MLSAICILYTLVWKNVTLYRGSEKRAFVTVNVERMNLQNSITVCGSRARSHKGFHPKKGLETG
jgi:hypothetical protein